MKCKGSQDASWSCLVLALSLNHSEEKLKISWGKSYASMPLNYFCASVILGCCALQGHGQAAASLGCFLHTAPGASLPKWMWGFSDALSAFPTAQAQSVRGRSKGWGACPCYFVAVFQKSHLEMSLQVCYCCAQTEKKRERKNSSSVGQRLSIQTNLHFRT